MLSLFMGQLSLSLSLSLSLCEEYLQLNRQTHPHCQLFSEEQSGDSAIASTVTGTFNTVSDAVTYFTLTTPVRQHHWWSAWNLYMC